MDDTSLNARERAGKRVRYAAYSVVGAPLALVFIVPYLLAARRGLPDSNALRTMAAVAVTMAILPLWILLGLRLAGILEQN